MNARRYVCGYCGNALASELGYYATVEDSGGKLYTGFIYICHFCDKPTFFDGGQVPGPPFAGNVKYIPSKEVEALYEEARNCMKVNAYTAASMCCRKLLMNIAVSEGAKEGKTFAGYVDYLANEGYLGAKAKVWIDHIRDKGNDANHEIRMMEREDAERLIKFCEMMLKTMYEYPAEAEGPGKGPARRQQRS
jgi:hypothetical protein